MTTELHMSVIHPGRAFSVLAVAYIMTIVDPTIVNVALPSISRDQHFPSPACSGS